MSEDLVVRIAEKWGYLIWNAHSEMTEDYAGVKSKVESAIREALEEVAKPCLRCNGSGYVPSTEPHGSLNREIPRVNKPCPDCKAVERVQPEPTKCPTCGMPHARTLVEACNINCTNTQWHSQPSTSVEPQVEPSEEDLIADAFAKAAANCHGGTIQTKIVDWTPTHENCDECNKLAPKMAADSVSHPDLIERLHVAEEQCQRAAEQGESLIAERDREWCLALAEIGVAALASSVRGGKISVEHEDKDSVSHPPPVSRDCRHCGHNIVYSLSAGGWVHMPDETKQCFLGEDSPYAEPGVSHPPLEQEIRAFYESHDEFGADDQFNTRRDCEELIIKFAAAFVRERSQRA